MIWIRMDVDFEFVAQTLQMKVQYWKFKKLKMSWEIKQREQYIEFSSWLVKLLFNIIFESNWIQIRCRTIT